MLTFYVTSGICKMLFSILLLSAAIVEAVSVEYCNNGAGVCKELTDKDCPEVFFNLHLSGYAVKYCNELNDIVCCPIPLSEQRMQVSNFGQQGTQPLGFGRRYESECRHYNETHPKCKPKPFIVDGTKAAGRELKFMALIGKRSSTRKSHGPNEHIKWTCGGTLIHKRFVLSAAHCFETQASKAETLDPNSDAPKFVVRLGELDHNITTDDARPEDFNVVNYVLHPFYNDDIEYDESQQNDIAVVELDRNVTYNDYIAPACLPPSSGNEYRLMTAAGWGLTKEAGYESTHLLKVNLERFSDEECSQRVERKISAATQFCAGSTTGNGDTCNGDSGGPIFVQHPHYSCLTQIIGITSYGIICGKTNFPSVYTKVHLYTNWIESIIFGRND